MKQESIKAPDPERYLKLRARVNWWAEFSRHVSLFLAMLGTLYLVKALTDGRLEIIRLTKENQQLREKCH